MKNAWVRTDGEWININDVEVINCEESPYGDIVTFVYNDEEYESRVVIGSRPGN